jgi:hypothetical protein
MVYESMTEPWTQEMSSFTVGGPQTASIRIPEDDTSTRTCSRCMALNTVRESVASHGASSVAPPPAAVMWVTP